ncbi:hypothetical protein [Otoolea muris]|uniref:hypothetical protein n=1 Tax=Otoolea muris TaxID=2941515 RepID=UPI00203E3280|nr:hypothetical protein [Otoolea muris]
MNRAKEIVLSSLGHTWILDLDGTLVKHNGYKIDGADSLLNGARSFIDSIPAEDYIIILTSRKEKYRNITERFLQENYIRYDALIFDIPYGERIVINDCKPGGLITSIAINMERDQGEFMKPVINRQL